MARPRTGSAYLKRGAWHAAITLDGGKKYECTVPPRADGVPIDEAYACHFAAELTRRYKEGLFDPHAPVAPTLSAPKTLTVLGYARGWIKGQTYTTVKDDQYKIERYLAPSVLAEMPLDDKIRPSHILDFINWLKCQPSQRGGNLAHRTVRNIFSITSRVFDGAVLADLIVSSPCDKIPKRTIPLRDKDSGARVNWKYSREEVVSLISDTRIPWDRRVAYGILFLTGCRAGEFEALRWRDWNDELEPLGRLSVTRSIEKTTRQEKSTKTGVGREVPVHPTLATILAEWKRSGWEQTFGRKPRPEDLIVPALPKELLYARKQRGQSGRGIAGLPIKGETQLLPRRVWGGWAALKKDLEMLGLRTNRRQHDTRRTMITIARDDGADVSILKWITHGSMSSIMDVYSNLGWSTLCKQIMKIKIKRV